MTRDIAPFGVRMPPELKARIETAASAAGRSINAEIVLRLQQSFVPLPGADLSAIPSGALLHEVISRYGQSVKIEIGGTAAQDLADAKPPNS